MVNVCCYGFSNKTGTLMILKLSVLIGIYLFGRELVELFVKPRGAAAWKIWYLILSPLIEISITVIGIYGVKKTRPAFLLPVLIYKLVYTVVYTIILFSLPFALSFISSNSFIGELKEQFNMDGGHVRDVLSPIPTAMMMVFISTLIYPMEDLLKLSTPAIIAVYTLYLCIVNIFQIYFMVVIYMHFKDMLKEIKRSQVQRYVINPVPGPSSYTVAPEGASLPYIPAPEQHTYVNVVEQKFRLLPPNPLTIN